MHPSRNGGAIPTLKPRVSIKAAISVPSLRWRSCYGAACHGVSPPVAVRSMLCDFGNTVREKTHLTAAPREIFTILPVPEDQKDTEHYKKRGQERPYAQFLTRDEIAQ